MKWEVISLKKPPSEDLLIKNRRFCNLPELLVHSCERSSTLREYQNRKRKWAFWFFFKSMWIRWKFSTYMCDFKNKPTVKLPKLHYFLYIHIFKFSYHLWLVRSPLMTVLSVFKNAYKESRNWDKKQKSVKLNYYYTNKLGQCQIPKHNNTNPLVIMEFSHKRKRKKYNTV